MSAPSAPPSPASPLPRAKVIMNRRLVLMPTDCAMPRLSTAARTIAPQRVRSTPIQRDKIIIELKKIK